MIKIVVEKSMLEKIGFIWAFSWCLMAFPFVWIICGMYAISQMRLSAFAEMHRHIVSDL